MSTPSPYQYFTMEELTCHCGCGQMLMNHEYMVRLVALRRATGIPMPLHSAYRCPPHNAAVSSTGLAGPHTTGHSTDPGVSGAGALKILKMAHLFDMTGIGIKQKGPYKDRFIHLDDLPKAPGQPRPHIWSY